jgi:hypothetical protein
VAWGARELAASECWLKADFSVQQFAANLGRYVTLRGPMDARAR